MPSRPNKEETACLMMKDVSREHSTDELSEPANAVYRRTSFWRRHRCPIALHFALVASYTALFLLQSSRYWQPHRDVSHSLIYCMLENLSHIELVE
jgi:hypothetical protein